MLEIKKIIGLYLIILAVQPVQAMSAGEEDHDNLPDQFNYSIELFTAHSPFSSSLFAKMKNTQLSLIGFNFGHSYLQFSNLNIFLSSEVVLFGRMNYPINGHSGPKTQRSGLGIVPLRFTVPITRSGSRNHFYADTGLGFILFEKKFPNPDGTNLNVTIDLGIGYQFRISQNNSLSIGYRFHHLSNAGVGNINPGLDSNMIFISFKTFR